MQDDLEDLYKDYIKDLEAAIKVADKRWRILAVSEKYNTLGFIYNRIWPAGISGDPVVLGVIRKYFVKSGIMIERYLVEEARQERTGSTSGEFGDQGDEAGENPATPNDFLFSFLVERNKELADKIRLLNFMPFGFKDNLEITRGGSGHGDT